MNQIIHVILILDDSPSMLMHRENTKCGVNQTLDTLRAVTKETKQDIFVTIAIFASENYIAPGFYCTPLNETIKFTDNNMPSSGSGTLMNKALLNILSSVPSYENNLCCIFTDGETHDGELFPQASDMIENIKDQGYTFAYIGANQNVEEIVEKLNISKSNSMKYISDANGTRGAFYQLSLGIRKYCEFKAKGKNINKMFDVLDIKKTKMKVRGLECSINTPEARISDQNVNYLPPYAPTPAYVVDEYPACPDNWMHGSAKASSYFVPVKTGKGMWLDFNEASKKSRHHLAAVISVQGVNPVTGQRTSSMRLEKYENKCPIHDIDFQQDRFCSECEYKWPAQNYLASNMTPQGQFWIDGFRNEEGLVRQYIFTEEEEKRGIAQAISGDDRVFAIGIAFFRSKKKKPIPKPIYFGGFSGYSGVSGYSAISGYSGYSGCSRVSGYSGISGSWSTHGIMNATVDSIGIGASYPDQQIIFDEPIDVKSYEIAAGSKIKQTVYEDTNKISFWEDEPYAMLYINYADEKSVEQILAKGKRKYRPEGFLTNIPVGNS